MSEQPQRRTLDRNVTIALAFATALFALSLIVLTYVLTSNHAYWLIATIVSGTFGLGFVIALISKLWHNHSVRKHNKSVDNWEAEYDRKHVRLIGSHGETLRG